MRININLDKNFTAKYNQLQDKYGTDIARLNGFDDAQISYTDFIDNFVDRDTVADASIDGNSNVSHKDIVTLEREMPKPHEKLLAFNKIYYEIKKKFGFAAANRWLEAEWLGQLYMHDASSSSMRSYCFSYDLKDLAEKGLYFIDGQNACQANHLTTFVDFVKEFVSYACNRTSGAVGLANIIPYMFYFWKKDVDNDYLGIKTSGNEKYYARQNFQRFIYAVNQPYVRDGSQSAFTNTSVFDRPYFEALFGGAEFPNGEFMIDYEEEIIEFQKWYMEVMSEIRSTNMFTFPVSTISLLRKDGKFVDEEFARWAIAHNMKWSDSNLFVDTSVSSLSNCCFDGSQKVLTKSSNGVNYMTFRELYDAPYNQTKRNFTVYHNGSWVKGKAIRLPKRPMYKITTSNNKEIIVTDNHLNPTLRGDIPTTELSAEDYLLFNNHKLDSVKDVDSHLTYEQGYLIGMYLGNGTISGDDGEECTTRVSLSLDLEQFEKSCEIIRLAGAQIGEHDCFRSSKTYNNAYQVTIQSDIISTFIKQFVSGEYCFGKRLNLDCLLQSYEFRSGILDGYYLTNGCDCDKVYVPSSELAEDIEILLNSLGLQSVIDDTYDGDHRVYRVGWYESHGNTETHDVYVERNDKIYFKIKSIEKYAPSDEYCYCFEMPEDEPYFTLPNGIVTHNCRLKSNIKDLGYVKMPHYSFTA